MTHKTLIETDWHGDVTREIENDYHLEGIDIDPLFVFNRVNTFISITTHTEYTDYSRLALCQDSFSIRLYTVSKMIARCDKETFDFSQLDGPMSEVWRVGKGVLLQRRRAGNKMCRYIHDLGTNKSLWKFYDALDETCYNSEKAIDMYLFHTL